MNWLKKPYEAPAEYEIPTVEQLAHEYIQDRQKPDVPEDFGRRVARLQAEQAAENAEKERSSRTWKLF